MSTDTCSYKQKAQYLLNKIGNMVETIFHINRLLCLNCFALRFGLGPFQKTLLLFSFVLGPILEEHLEKVCCCIRHYIKSMSTNYTQLQSTNNNHDFNNKTFVTDITNKIGIASCNRNHKQDSH